MWSLATSLSWTSLALGYYLSSILAKIVNVVTGKGSLFHGLGDACLKIGFSGIPKALQDLKDSALQDPLLPIAQDKPIKECGMDGFLKEKGLSFTVSEIEDKKRSFEANPSEPIDDSVLLLRSRMHRAADYKRKKVVKDNS
ncbi:peptide transporter PTR2 [Carex littledalei]|uniref:Peptide transporter PTR2 n=1 Tax=Carex littledalei TaxID=544730 RepID=A0A833QUE8_9POAL|nr:peptide transporter PTR2 [Carex littledalei]